MIATRQEQEIQRIESQTEDDLIADVKNLSRRLNISAIVTYWEMGKRINSFYKGKYGNKELQGIAERTDVGSDTLTKACKFARQYSEEQLQDLIHGNFQLSWFQIAQNLSVEPQKLIGVYREVHNPSEFHNGIMNLKNPGETRGKAKKVDIKSQQINKVKDQTASPETEDRNEIRDDVFYENIRPPLDGNVFDVMDEPEDPGPDPEYESYRQELETLREENAKLKAQIWGQTDYDQLNTELEGCLKRMEKMKTNGAKYQSILRNIYNRVSDGTTAEELFAELQADVFEPFLTGRILKM